LDKVIDINLENKRSYTTRYEQEFLKYVENDYCAKHRRVPVNKPESVPSSNLFPSAMATGSSQSCFYLYDFSGDSEEYTTPDNVTEMTSRCSDPAVSILATARHYLYSWPEVLMNWEHINPNINEYHSDPTKISSTYCIPNITDWCHQQGEMHSTYADLSNVACDIFNVIQHCIRVEASIFIP
jgi:hypothetical protein